MATSGSFKTKGWSDDLSPDYYLFSWELKEQSIAENYSIIKWSLTGAGGYNEYYWTEVANKYVTVNGETKSSTSWQKTYNGTVAFSGETKIYHNTDGTKTFSASAGGAFYESGSYNSTGSGSWELPKIPRHLTINSFTITDVTETTAVVHWSTSDPRSGTYYSLDNGATWIGSATYGESLASDNKSGSFNVHSLNAGTTYNIKIKIKRTDSGLWTETDNKSFTTYHFPHCISTPDFTIGNNVRIEFYNPLNRTIQIQMWSHISRDFVSDLITTNGTSYTGFGDVQDRLYSSIPSNTESKYNIDVYYANNKAIREGGKYLIKGNEVPTINAFDYIDSNYNTVAITGNNKHIVQNKSILQAQFHSATANYWAGGISKYIIEVNGYRTERTVEGAYDLGTVNSSRDVQLILTAVDTRGLSSSKSINVTMLEHSNPKAVVTLERLNNYEDETYLAVDGSISSVNSKNTMEIKYRYKVSGGDYNNFSNIADREKLIFSFDKNNAYIFNIVITDAFGSQFNREFVLGKGVFPLFIDTEKNSVGINCFPTREKSFEVEGKFLNDELLTRYTVNSQNYIVTPNVDVTQDYSGGNYIKIDFNINSPWNNKYMDKERYFKLRIFYTQNSNYEYPWYQIVVGASRGGDDWSKRIDVGNGQITKTGDYNVYEDCIYYSTNDRLNTNLGFIWERINCGCTIYYIEFYEVMPIIEE